MLVVAAEIDAGWSDIPFYASALLSVSINRFVLSSLSAALPHVVERPILVGANALTTTSGAIAATCGGATAIALRSLVGSDSNLGYAFIAAGAGIPYLLAAFAASRFTRPYLGPDDVELTERETFGAVVRGLVAGGAHIRSHRPVLLALLAIGGHRFCYGISTICTLLLYRNYFHDDGVFRAGLAGLGQVVVAVAIGGGLAAVFTPAITRRTGLTRYACVLLLAAAVTQFAFGLPFTMPALLTAAFLLGYIAQGVKITVDTTVQQNVTDEFRGRVFSLYDTLFNLTFVSAATLTAFRAPRQRQIRGGRHRGGHRLPAHRLLVHPSHVGQRGQRGQRRRRRAHVDGGCSDAHRMSSAVAASAPKGPRSMRSSSRKR